MTWEFKKYQVKLIYLFFKKYQTQNESLDPTVGSNCPIRSQFLILTVVYKFIRHPHPPPTPMYHSSITHNLGNCPLVRKIDQRLV